MHAKQMVLVTLIHTLGSLVLLLLYLISLQMQNSPLNVA